MAQQTSRTDAHELTEIGGVGPEKAESLRDAGFESVADVREASTDELVGADGFGEALATEVEENARSVATDGEEVGEGEGVADGEGEGAQSGGAETDDAAGGADDLDLMSIRDEAGEVASELIDDPFDGIIEIERDGDGWYAVVEVVERSAVPDSQDILGRYEIDFDGSGSVTAYRLTDRYRRGDVSG